MINEIQYLPGLGYSDHVCLSFKFMCYAVDARNLVVIIVQNIIYVMQILK